MNGISVESMAAARTPGERVHDFIMEKISSRYWGANSKIMTERELCAALGVSRIAVREAVERLVTLGLLVKRQGAGTFVADVQPDSCFDFLYPMILLDETNISLLLEFRGNFEHGNVKLFMKHHRAEDLEALEKNYGDMVMARDVDPGLSWVLDYEFHQIIAMGTHNPFIIRISTILTGILRSHQTLLYKTGDPDNPYDYHREIIKYIKRGDGKIAASLMRKHISISMKSFRRQALEKTDDPRETGARK